MTQEKSTVVLMTEFIACITRSTQAAWAMVHSHQDTRFLKIRDCLELVKQRCLRIAVTHTHQQNDPGVRRATIIRN